MPEKDTTGRPTLELVADLDEHNERVWKKQRDRDDDVLEVLNDDHLVATPDTENEKREFKITPEVMKSGLLGTVHRRSSAFYPVPASLDVMQEAGTPAASKAGNAVEWLEEWLDQAIEDAGEDVWRLLIDDGLALGRVADIVVAWNGYYWNPPKDLSDDIEKRNEALKGWLGKAPVPAAWRHIPARSVFPPSIGRLNDEALSVQDVLATDILDHFGESEATATLRELITDKAMGHYDTVKLATYGNRSHVGYFVLGDKLPAIEGRQGKGGMELSVYKHGMDINAIQITPTFTTAQKEPGRYWTCPVMECVELVKSLDRRLSESATHSRMAGMGPWLGEFFEDALGEEGASSMRDKRMQGDLWKVYIRESGAREDIRPINPPEQSALIFDLVRLALEFIERKTGIGPALAGQFQGRDIAAASIKIAADLASEIYDPASVALSRHSKKIGERCFAAVAQFGEDAPLSKQGDEPGQGLTLTLSPSDAKSFRVLVKAQLEPRFKVTENSDVGLYLEGLRLKAQGVQAWPDRYGVERWLREKNYAAFKREMRVDGWEASPDMEAFYTQEAMLRARVRVAEMRAVSPAELLAMREEGVFEQAPGLERALEQRGALPPRSTQFPPEATGQSLRQTGVVPATVQAPTPEAELA